MGKIYVVNWPGFSFRPLVTRGPPFNIDPWAYICRWLAREGKGDIGVVGCGVPKKIPTRPDSFPCNYRPFGQSGRGMGRLGARANVPTSKDSTYPKTPRKGARQTFWTTFQTTEKQGLHDPGCRTFHRPPLETSRHGLLKHGNIWTYQLKQAEGLL